MSFLRVIVALCLFIALNAHAETHLMIRGTSGGWKDKARVPAISPATKIWVSCFTCQSYVPFVANELEKAGYRVTADRDEADIRLVLGLQVGVRQGDKTPLIDAEDVYGQELEPIPPVLSSEAKRIAVPGVTTAGVFGIDAGHAMQGAQITGSSGGGAALGMLGGVILSFIERNEADKTRTPGVVQGFIRVTDRGEKSGLGFVAAADTAETPDALVRGTIAKIVGMLSTGFDVPPTTKR